MIPMSNLYIEKAHDGDEELFLVTNAYGEIVFESYNRLACEEFINGIA